MKRTLRSLAIIILSLLVWVSASEAKVKLCWNHPVEYGMGDEAPMVVHAGKLYCGNYELDSRSGKILQEFESENVGYRIRDIRFSEGAVFFARAKVENEEESYRSFEFLWNAFDLKSGKLLWEIAATGENSRQAGPALLETCGQQVLVIKDLEREQACCLQARSGEKIWSQTIVGCEDLGAGQEQFFVQTGEYLMALSAVDGRLLWKTKLPLSHFELMTVGKENIYVPRKEIENDLAIMLALDQKTGRIIWQKDFPKADLFRPLEWQGNLFFVSQPADDQPGCLLALDIGTGKEKWRQVAVADHNGNDFQPQLFRDKLLFWSGDAEYLKKHSSSGTMRLLCLNQDDGKIVWEYFPPYPDAVYYRLLPNSQEIYLRTSGRLLRLQVNEEALPLRE